MSIDSSHTATEYAHIVRAADEPRIDGHRIRVRDIVAARQVRGLTPEQIVAEAYPDLQLAEVYAALAFYEDHRDEIDLAAAREEAMVEQFLRDHPRIAVDHRVP